MYIYIYAWDIPVFLLLFVAFPLFTGGAVARLGGPRGGGAAGSLHGFQRGVPPFSPGCVGGLAPFFMPFFNCAI